MAQAGTDADAIENRRPYRRAARIASGGEDEKEERPAGRAAAHDEIMTCKSTWHQHAYHKSRIRQAMRRGFHDEGCILMLGASGTQPFLAQTVTFPGRFPS